MTKSTFEEIEALLKKHSPPRYRSPRQKLAAQLRRQEAEKAAAREALKCFPSEREAELADE